MTACRAPDPGTPRRRVDGEARVVRAVTLAAAAIALLVATLVPASAYWLTWQAQVQDTSITARLHAAFVTQALSRSTGDWRNDVVGLLDDPLVDSRLPEARRIVDAHGAVVAESGPLPAAPVVTARAPIARGESVVGEVVLMRSLRPLLARALAVLLTCVLLGGAIYLTLQVLPMRALRRALLALAHEQARSRRELEQYANVLFERAIDGILVVDARGLVLSCNPRAAQMLGVLPAQVVHTPMRAWIEMPASPEGTPMPVGQFEALARRGTEPGESRFPCEITISAMPPGAGGERYLGSLRDLTERKLAEQRQTRLANFDSLTGLPNRGHFREKLEKAMARARLQRHQVAVMFLDLDRFKQVNDSLGHHAGDTLLKHVASSLSQCLRRHDEVTIARLGGDEFTVLLEGVETVQQVEAIARRILDALQTPLLLGGNEIVITSSLGIALYPADDCSLDELLKHADMAMYQAKEMGRNAYHVYTEAMQANTARRLQLEGQLRRAIERGEFRLHYQPKCRLADGRVTGVEALLRWYPQEGQRPVEPGQFIGVLEDTGLIVDVGRWVLREAVQQLATWQAQGLPPLSVAVNLSARQLRQPNVQYVIDRALQDAGVSPGQLELELTESLLVAGDEVAATLRSISALGVRLAIDDFGTGYSSLAYLKRFCVDTLKIDRSFVMEMPGNAEDGAISAAIIALARRLHLRVVAEGVETAAQQALLRELGCDEMQGYLLSPPMPAEAFLPWWHAHVPHGEAARSDRMALNP